MCNPYKRVSNFLFGKAILHGIGLEVEKECSLGKVVREGLMEEAIFRVRPVRSEEPAIQRGWG